MADYQVEQDRDGGLVNITGSIAGLDFSSTGSAGMTVKEVILNESILNPGLQTIVTFQSYIHIIKNLDGFKGGMLNMNLKSDHANMTVSQKVYRLDNREFMPINVGSTEEFSLHACDPSLLNDAKSLVSKSWKCETPDTIVKYVLQSCAGVRNLDVQSSQPARDYLAEFTSKCHRFSKKTSRSR